MTTNNISTQMSGHSYISAVPKGGTLASRIPLRWRVCDHTQTLCPECMDLWELDYVLLLSATAGGRRLLQYFEDRKKENER